MIAEALRAAAYRAYAFASPWYRAGRLDRWRAFLAASQRWSRAEIEAWQLERLRALVAVAETTPFWPARLRAAGVSSTTLRGLDDLRRLPVLDKSTIRDAPVEMLHAPAPPLFRAGASSGTTGRPLRVRTPAEMDAAGRAARWRMLEWFGVPFGAATASFTGGNAPRGARLFATWWLAGHVLGQAYMDAFRNPFERDLAWLRRVRPAAVIGYPNVLVRFARDAAERGVDLRALGVRMVMLGGETIDARQRTIVSEAFGAPSAALYGSHEGHFMATECPDGALHVVEPVVIEVVDAEGRPCADGEAGDVLVTPLLGHAMPLFRYRIGDRGRLHHAPCPCGFAMPHLSLDLGRTSDFVRTPSGRTISSQFIQPILHQHFGLQLGVDPVAYRVTQTAIDRLLVEVELPAGAPMPEGAQHFLDERTAPVLQGEVTVHVEPVARLAPDRSGKLRCFIPLDETARRRNDVR